MEPVEYGQRHGHVSDDGPGPQTVEVQLNGMRVGPRLLQRVDGPHGQVADQQERDDLPAGLLANLVGRHARPPGRVQYEHRLAERLHQRRGRRDQHQHRVVLLREMPADYRERAVYERASLRTHQQYVVQLQVAQAVEFQLPHLQTSWRVVILVTVGGREGKSSLFTGLAHSESFVNESTWHIKPCSELFVLLRVFMKNRKP